MSPKASDAHRAWPWVMPPYLLFYLPCIGHPRFAGNLLHQKISTFWEHFLPPSKGISNSKHETVCPMLLRLPCSQTGIACCKQLCRNHLYLIFHLLSHRLRAPNSLQTHQFCPFDPRSSRARLVSVRVVPSTVLASKSLLGFRPRLF